MTEKIIDLMENRPDVYLKAYDTPFARKDADALLILPGGGQPGANARWLG
jgi:hypothetical protein